MPCWVLGPSHLRLPPGTAHGHVTRAPSLLHLHHSLTFEGVLPAEGCYCLLATCLPRTQRTRPGRARQWEWQLQSLSAGQGSGSGI